MRGYNQQRVHLAVMEDAPDAPESLRDRVAHALYVAQCEWDDEPPVEWQNHYAHEEWLQLADAAIAVICTPVEGAP